MLEETGDQALRRERVLWILPAGSRRLLAAMVIGGSLVLAVMSDEVNPPPPGAIPILRIDPNTAPPQVLGALPRVGPASRSPNGPGP